MAPKGRRKRERVRKPMTPEQRFEILKIELSLIQSRFDKYDDLIFRGRNSFVTLWLACLGLSFTIRSVLVPWLAVALSVLYWFLEGMMRHQYWFKYVGRYRFLRDSLNKPGADISHISVYDLTNTVHRSSKSSRHQIKACFFKLEPTVLYGVMGVAAVLLWLFLRLRILTFPK
jgi:hypothetical protein